MIQWNKDTLEKASSISEILGIAETEWANRKKLFERIVRKTVLSELVSIDDKEIKIAFENYINSVVTGYFAGKAPVYDVEKTITDEKKISCIKKLFNKLIKKESTDSEELKLLIDYISKYNDDPTEFFELAFDYFGMRAAYEVLYENDENEIVYTKVSPLNTIAIYDYSTPVNQIGQLRKWTEKDEKNVDITIVELTTINGKKYYTPTPDNVKVYKELDNKSEKGKWGMLPCIAYENENSLSSFELAISIIVAYERVIQNARNTFKYNDAAKLKITGYKPQNPLMVPKKDKNGEIEKDKNNQVVMEINEARKKEDETLLEMEVFYTPEDGDIGWIEKNVQDGAIENHKKTLIDLISLITGVPNITDLGFTNADNASALDRKFFALEQMITKADKVFKKEILRRWETIIDRINKRKSTNYDFRSIKIDLQRNLPTDKDTETARALKLRGLLPDETIIDMLPDDLDSASELEKMDLQNQENITKNLENMKKMGQDVSNASLNVSKDKSVQDKNVQFEVKENNQSVKDEVKKENIKQSDTITRQDKNNKIEE